MARMTKVEKYAAIRRDSRMEGLSQRDLARKYAVSRRTVAEALTSAWPAPHGRHALGTEAAMAEYRVKYVLAAKLVNELVEAADELILNKRRSRYTPERGRGPRCLGGVGGCGRFEHAVVHRFE